MLTARPEKIVLGIVSSLISGVLAAHADAPFWRVKEKYKTRVAAGEPVVSVSTRKLEGPRRRLAIVGGGRVATPLDFTFDFARRLDRVARLTGYVERAEMNDARDRLHLVFAALGRKAEFDLRVSADPAAHRLEFEILGGPLKGLVAKLDFTALGKDETEVGIDGQYDYETFPFKGAVLSVGLEAVFKAMAERLRDGAVAARKDVDKSANVVKDSGASGDPRCTNPFRSSAGWRSPTPTPCA